MEETGERERKEKEKQGGRVLRGETIAFPLAGFLSSYRNSIDNTETNFISPPPATSLAHPWNRAGC